MFGSGQRHNSIIYVGHMAFVGYRFNGKVSSKQGLGLLSAACSAVKSHGCERPSLIQATA